MSLVATLPLAEAFSSSTSGYFTSIGVTVLIFAVGVLYARAVRKDNEREGMQRRNTRDLEKRLRRIERRQRRNLELATELGSAYKETAHVVRRHTDDLEEFGDVLAEIKTETRLLKQRMLLNDQWKAARDEDSHND